MFSPAAESASYCCNVLVGILVGIATCICFEKKIEKKGHGKKLKNEKFGQDNVEYNVLTQRTSLEYRATLNRATRTTLTSPSFGRYTCLLCFLRPLITRRGLLATSWRRSFDLLLSLRRCRLRLHDVRADRRLHLFRSLGHPRDASPCSGLTNLCS